VVDFGGAASGLNSPHVITAAADVRDAAQVESFLEATVACWGRIDVILSNAGDPSHIAPVTEYPEDAFDRTMSIHARGVFLVCKYGLSQMNDGGSIIITSSVVGVRGGTGINLGYAAAKHAQVGVMRAAARFAAARGIRVNALNPGAIDKAFQTGIEDRMGKLSGVNVTDQLNQTIPIKRHARPDEVAGAALYLTSDRQRHNVRPLRPQPRAKPRERAGIDRAGGEASWLRLYLNKEQFTARIRGASA
jgi:NAD(P)-dependent dehydrogenase (short-subunit alcohol dehydrogenase family)